jgi:ABC-type Fe3+-citrate transport system substrate-binding protein
MKKYIESIMMLFIGMVVVTACSNKDDDDYSWATVSGEQVFFSTDLSA